MSQENQGFFAPKGSGIRRFQQVGMALVLVSVVGVFTGTIDSIMWFLQEVVSWILAVVIFFFFLKWLFT